MSVLHARQTAVAALRAQLRQMPLADERQPDLPALRGALIALAARTELFAEQHFPVRAGRRSGIYRLFEEAGHGTALYVAAGLPGHRMPPHRHPAWSVFVGIQGEEHNALFDRVDDGREPGHGRLAARGELSLQAGDGLCMAAEAFHETTIRGAGQGLHFHCYGVPIDTWGGELPVFATADAHRYDPVRRQAGQRIALVEVPDTPLDEWRLAKAAGLPATVLALGPWQAAWATQVPGLHHLADPAQAHHLPWPDGEPLLLLGPDELVFAVAGTLAAAGHVGVSRLVLPGDRLVLGAASADADARAGAPA